MGLWEDAQQQRQQLDAAEARQGQQDDEPRRREADAAAAQQEAVGEFIAAMGQLGIAPQRHRWLEERLLFKPRLSIRGVRGWSVHSPRSRNDGGMVVTPNGDVYYLHIRRGDYRRPLDPPVYGFGAPLVEILRDGLVRAMQGH